MNRYFTGLVSFFLLALNGYCFAWDSGRLATPLVIDDKVIPYPIFTLFFLPEQPFNVHFKDAKQSGTVTFNGVSEPVGGQPLAVPELPGIYPLKVINSAGQEEANINIVAMVPANEIDNQGYLRGYRIGQYPAKALNDNEIYLPPKGFVEVTEENRHTRVSPNFVLGQFVSKQSPAYPKYLVLRANLLLKLENILAALNQSGKKTEGFVIMSGYRTPWYNRRIGNVPYSRHVWGGASDFYIDENPADGVMDDLNGDGKVTRADAQWLANFISDLSRRGLFGSRIGGLGVYGSNSAHGPFVHVDVRGNRARW
jgi:hypothetical protein